MQGIMNPFPKIGLFLSVNPLYFALQLTDDLFRVCPTFTQQ